MSLPEERCCECDDLTGRAGPHDDSLFYEIEHGFECPGGDFRKPDNVGPLCETCYAIIVECDRVAGIEAENAALRAELDFLYGQFQMHSPKMNGEHSWRFLHHWPMTYAVGPDIRTAIHRAMKELEQHARDNPLSEFPMPND